MVKRTPLLLTLGFLLFTAGGITLYQYIVNKSELSIWDLVPQQTVLVCELDDCIECDQQKSAIAQLLKSTLLDFNDSTKKNLEILFSVKKGKSISLHATSKDDFDVIYYFSENQERDFDGVVNAWKGSKKIKYSERELNGSKIQEFSFEKKLFSCVQIEKIWIGSFTPFLIEDVIRTFSSGEKSAFTKEMTSVNALPRVRDDIGNIYVHLPNFMDWLNVFPERNAPSISTGEVSLLDIKYDENSFTLNGFSLASRESGSLLSYFQTQSPVQFLLKQYVSNRTVFSATYGVSDGAALYNNLDISKNKNTQDSLSGLAKSDFAQLYQSFGKEMSVCYQESRNNSLSKVVLFETSNIREWLNYFDQLSKASESEDTVFYEKYSTYEIREIEISNLDGKLFSPLTSGFSQTYYSTIGNTIILSEQLEEIKQFLDDIDQENVWGKSVPFNKFLESTLLESNVSIYINTPLVWNILIDKLNPRWKKFITQNQSTLNSFDLGAIQFSHLNESFYTNITWTYTPQEQSPSTGQPVKTDRIVASLNSSIIGRPSIVRSHVSGVDEVLVQDSLYNLYHLSDQGKVLWKVTLDEPIISDIKQIDFFNNGKLQFLFTTSKKIHVIDRLGNHVSPFPVDIKIKDVEFLSVVDYDNSKKYRFLMADKSGRLWMYDKEFQNLEGWRPKNVENGLLTAARHHRIRGKDYILALRKDGWVHLINRRGENVKGFPLNLDARLDGEYFINIGNSPATTNFTCISKDGFRIKFNLEGKILSKETLVKPSFETQFSLIAEQKGKSYVIKRQDARRLSVLNEDGVELFNNDFVGLNPVKINYYDFGAGKIYFTVTDVEQEASFIYDGKGNLLTKTPIEGRAMELRPDKADFPKTFVVDFNTLTIR